MKQVQKLNNLINRIIKEEMSRSKSEESSESSKMDEDKVEITPDGTDKTATTAQKQDVVKAKAGEKVSYKKPGQTNPMQEEDENTQEHDEYTQDIDHVDADGEQDDLAARALAEAAGQMKGIVEAPKDAKHAKHAAKVLKHVEAANEALGHLRGHEKMLQAKQNGADQKEGEKHLKAIEKHLSKVVKDKDAVGKMMKKMPIEKVLALKKAKGGELDEEKVAKALLTHVIKEGYFTIKKKHSLNEDYGKKLGMGVFIVTPEAIEDISYGTDWVSALTRKKIAELIKGEKLFFYNGAENNKKYLIYSEGDHITVLNDASEIVDEDSREYKYVKDAVRIASSKMKGDSRYDK